MAEASMTSTTSIGFLRESAAQVRCSTLPDKGKFDLR
jgi:hypothetical protein